MAGELTDFLANMTEGATAFGTMIGSVADTFMQPPFVILPIAGVVGLSYKVTMKIVKKIKSAA